MSANKKRLVITGSEGLVGKKLTEYYGERFEVLKLSRSLNSDLTDENFVSNWFKQTALWNDRLPCFQSCSYTRICQD